MYSLQKMNLDCVYSPSSHELLRSFERKELLVPDSNDPEVRWQAQVTRQGYTKELRENFRATAVNYIYDQLGGVVDKRELLTIISTFHIHHKHPVWMGGTNDDTNLVLMDDGLHTALHEEFSRATNRAAKVRPYLQLSNHTGVKDLKRELSKAHGLRVDEDGNVWASIAWPKGKCVIPHLYGLPNLQTYSEFGRPKSSKLHASVVVPRYL